MLNEHPRSYQNELGTIQDLNPGELLTVPRTHIVVAVCSSGDWSDFLVIKRGSLTRDAEELKRALDRRVIEHLKSGGGKRVDFVHGKSINEISLLAKTQGVEIPKILKDQLKFSLGIQSEGEKDGLLPRFLKKILPNR